jgi:hypothetical protein
MTQPIPDDPAGLLIKPLSGEALPFPVCKTFHGGRDLPARVKRFQLTKQDPNSRASLTGYTPHTRRTIAGHTP